MKYISCIPFVLLLVMVALSTLVGCSTSSDFAIAQSSPATSAVTGSAISIDPVLAGRWVRELEDGSLADNSNMDFLKDGTGILDYTDVKTPVRSTGYGIGITWRAEEGYVYTFYNTYAGNMNAHVYGYKITGTTLTLTTVDGEKSMTYKKR